MSVWICSRAILAWLLNLSTFPTVRSWNSGKFVINLGFITAIVIERHSFKLLQNARLIRESDLFEYCGCESPNLNKINTKANIFNIILCLRGKKWDLFLLRPDQAYPILWFCVICCPLFSRPVPQRKCFAVNLYCAKNWRKNCLKNWGKIVEKIVQNLWKKLWKIVKKKL